ncbi:M28 family peptidase [Parasphingorhabdus halotolerans]|uniref:Vacuolar membrane protease n=1 Tax=Parasphingorhabdus halotolerans TaxID=2725558 RepID=A0A6H2DL12_9SPHN|nr:M28 family peptidase [Parasphingorhabdus halotolerans]QJB68888.1 M28 family peptidase [Parasphingorhabdus halotolerans]
MIALHQRGKYEIISAHLAAAYGYGSFDNRHFGFNAAHPREIEGSADFSITRATATVAAITKAPHLAGSPEHGRVRDYLVGRLESLGLETQVQSEVGVRQSTRFEKAIAVSPVDNIIAVLPGRDRTKPAVAVMAHYDSVHFSPGASDDASGTAAVVETARLLSAGQKPARDVIFLITDAEELGLIGAQSFFESHPLAKRIGIVVNGEARGSRGWANMFQTSTGNAALVRLWADNAVAPSGNSMASAIYRLLPNDTDLSVSLDAGKAGINAAFINSQFDYHAPQDNADNLSPATLQHLGDFMHTTTRAMAMAETLPSRDDDSAYFDIFGKVMVQYPIAWGWALLVIAALGLWRMQAGVARQTSEGVNGWKQSLGGAGIVLLLTVVAGIACHVGGLLIYGEGTIAGRERLAEAGTAFWFYVALCAGMILIIRPRIPHWTGSALLVFLLAVAAQIALPGANWLPIWPLLVALLIAVAAGKLGVDSAIVQVLCFGLGGLVFAQIFVLTDAFYISVGAITPSVVAIFVPFFILLLGPLILPWSLGKHGRRLGTLLVVFCISGGIWLAATDGFSDRYPRPGDLFHYTDIDSKKSYWATTSGADELPGGPGTVVRYIRPTPSKRMKFRITRAPKTPVALPEFALEKSADKAMLSVKMAEIERDFYVFVRPSQPVKDIRLNGKPVNLPAKKWTMINHRAESPIDFKLEWNDQKAGRIALKYLFSGGDMPDDAPEPNGPPTNQTRFSGSKVVKGSAEFSWPKS